MPEPVGLAAAPVRQMVLVHGAWQGGWAFDAWLPLLQARGWVVHAVDLPGSGWGPLAGAPPSLAAYTAHVAGLLAALPTPAVLVGHSGGGLTVAQVAELLPGRVAGLVYLAGMMLPSGLPFADLVQRCEADNPGSSLSGIGPHLRWSADGRTSEVPEGAALDIFLHDCAPDAARRAARLLRPQSDSGRAMVNALTPGRWGRVPRWYVECTQDRSLRLPVQRAMQALSPGAARLTLECGHVPQLARPMQLTTLLCPLIEHLPASTAPAGPA